jgi:hypothetical protein
MSGRASSPADFFLKFLGRDPELGPNTLPGKALAGNEPVEGMIPGEAGSMIVATPTRILVYNPRWDREQAVAWDLGGVTGVEFTMGTLHGAVAVRSVDAPGTPLLWEACRAAPDGIRLAWSQAAEARRGFVVIQQLVSAVDLARLLVGLEPGSTFVCDECGGLASTWAAAVAGFDSAMTAFGQDLDRVVRFASEPRLAEEPIRPGSLQGVLKVSYDEAVRVLEILRQYGLVERAGKGFGLADPLCPECYSRRLRPQPEPSQPPARDPVPPQLRFRVLQRDGFRCQYCGRSARDGAQLHLDHVTPVSAGGETHEGNLITACEQCNLGKSTIQVV